MTERTMNGFGNLMACFMGILIIVSGFHGALQAQNAPVTTAATIGNALPGPVAVPLTVTGFQNINSMSLTLDYQSGVVQYTGATVNPLIGGSFSPSDSDIGNGWHRIVMSWFGSSASLPDGSTVITVNFTYLTGSTPLIWFDNGGSCQYSNSNYVILTDTPTTEFYHDGAICGPVGAAGVIAGKTGVCEGETGVTYSTPPAANATGYDWQVPAGSVIASGAGTNSILVDFPSGVSGGDVGVTPFNDCGSGTSSFLTVMVFPLPTATISGGDSLCDDGSQTTLSIDLTGTAPWNFTWSDGVNTYPVFSQLTSPYLITTAQAGTYTVLAVSDNYCTGTTSGVAIVTVSPVPPAPVVTYTGGMLHSDQCCGNQWYLDGLAIPGADGEDYMPAQSGNYFATVTLQGCMSDESNIIQVSITSLHTIEDENIQIAPNPANDRVMIYNLNNISSIRAVDFFTLKGESVRVRMVENRTPFTDFRYFTGTLEEGCYIVKIHTDNQTIIKKLFITR